MELEKLLKDKEIEGRRAKAQKLNRWSAFGDPMESMDSPNKQRKQNSPMQKVTSQKVYIAAEAVVAQSRN